jgi:predicted methyltransferase
MQAVFARFATISLAIALASCARPEPISPAKSADATSPSASASVGAAPPATTGAVPGVSPAIRSAFSAPDRSEEDKKLDAGRKADELLSFFGIAPGMRVAELGAGGGYTAELLARVVGDKGRVYAQNSKFLLERFAEKPWSERLKKPVMADVVRVDREFDDPLPPEAKDLDAVLWVLFSPDTVWLKTDRDKMNRAIFAALKPGGVYGIVDHSAREGAGVTEAESLHRIEERIVREEVARAGFVLEGESALLESAGDMRDWNASPRVSAERRGTSDRFVLRFEKP